MPQKQSWEKFQQTGLLWMVNQTLHLFGWSICIEQENGEVVDVYPARVKYRGFPEESNANGYKRVTKYLEENITTLSTDVKGED